MVEPPVPVYKEKMATVRKDMSERVVARCESMMDQM